jgi:hypothetical protein
MAFQTRHRDKNGEIGRKHGNTLIPQCQPACRSGVKLHFAPKSGGFRSRHFFGAIISDSFVSHGLSR